MNDWKNVQLGSLIDYKKGYAFKSKYYDSDGDNIIVRVSDTTIDSINISTCHKIKSEYVNGLDDYRLQTDDVIIATVGSWADNPQSIVGKVVKVPVAANGSLLNQNAVRLRAKNLLDQKYLFYSLRDNIFSSYLLNSAQGSANQASITLNDIFGYTAKLPPLPEQKAIADVLSALDDKIDLLQRQNETLEKMAETLFRQWFIEEAKEDWEEGTLSTLTNNIRDSVTTQSINQNDIYIGLEHIDRRNIALSRFGLGGEVSSNKSTFLKGDILFGKLRPYFHKVCIAPFQGICSTDILVLRAKDKQWQLFLLFAFFQNEVVEFANMSSGGTRMPRVDWGALGAYPIQIPPIEIIQPFNAIVSQSLNKIFLNLEQIQTLQNMRDTLLPKLMSGEVRVKWD